MISPRAPSRATGGARSRASQEFAEIGRRSGGLHIEAALAGDLEIGAGGVDHPRAVLGEARVQLAADHRHALGRIGAEVELAGSDDARGRLAAIAFEADALDLAVEVGVVLEHRAADRGAPAAASSPRVAPLSPCPA